VEKSRVPFFDLALLLLEAPPSVSPALLAAIGDADDELGRLLLAPEAAAMAMEPFFPPQTPAGCWLEMPADCRLEPSEGPVAAYPSFTSRAHPTPPPGSSGPAGVSTSEAAMASCKARSSLFVCAGAEAPAPPSLTADTDDDAASAAFDEPDGLSAGIARSSWREGPRRASAAALISAASRAATRRSSAARFRRRLSRCPSSSAKGVRDSGGSSAVSETSASLKLAVVGRCARNLRRFRVASHCRVVQREGKCVMFDMKRRLGGKIGDTMAV